MEILETIQLIISTLMILSAPAPTDQAATATEIVDGDTIKTQGPETEKTIRLIGVDTPEVYSKVSPQEFNASDEECLDNYADKASEYAEKQVLHRQVKLAADPSVDNKGSYGRLLRYIEQDNVSSSLNYRLIENGYARVYTDSSFSEKERYLRAESEARMNDVGLWKC